MNVYIYIHMIYIYNTLEYIKYIIVYIHTKRITYTQYVCRYMYNIYKHKFPRKLPALLCLSNDAQHGLSLCDALWVSARIHSLRMHELNKNLQLDVAVPSEPCLITGSQIPLNHYFWSLNALSMPYTSYFEVP